MSARVYGAHYGAIVLAVCAACAGTERRQSLLPSLLNGDSVVNISQSRDTVIAILATHAGARCEMRMMVDHDTNLVEVPSGRVILGAGEVRKMEVLEALRMGAAVDTLTPRARDDSNVGRGSLPRCDYRRRT